MEKLHLLKIVSFNASSPSYLPTYPPTHLPAQPTTYIPLLAFCFIQYSPPLSSNSTPFNPQSGPREAQWKPYDLPLLFLTLSPSQSGLIWSTLDLSQPTRLRQQLTFCSRVSMVSGLWGSILALLLAFCSPCGTRPRGTEETRGSPDRVPSTCTSRSRGSLSLGRRRCYFSHFSHFLISLPSTLMSHLHFPLPPPPFFTIFLLTLFTH